MSDMVNSPSHYTKRAATIEPIDVLRWAPFDLGCCLKYISRVGLKDDEVIDWKKARRYLFWAVESYEMFPDHIDWFFAHHGLYLKKFNQFSRCNTNNATDFFADVSILIKQNIEFLDRTQSILEQHGE